MKLLEAYKGKGWKLTWEGAWHENTQRTANDAEDADAADFAAGGDMPRLCPGALSHGRTACEAASRGRGGSKRDAAFTTFYSESDQPYQILMKPCVKNEYTMFETLRFQQR